VGVGSRGAPGTVRSYSYLWLPVGVQGMHDDCESGAAQYVPLASCARPVGWGRGSGFARRGWESARWPLFAAWGPHAMPRDPSPGPHGASAIPHGHAHAARAPCLVLSRGTAAPTTVTRASESRTAGSRLRTPARAGDAERPFFSNRPLHAGARSCVCCQPSSRDDAAGDYIGRGCLVTPTSAT
jgi:hypothetical protein